MLTDAEIKSLMFEACDNEGGDETRREGRLALEGDDGMRAKMTRDVVTAAKRYGFSLRPELA